MVDLIGLWFFWGWGVGGRCFVLFWFIKIGKFFYFCIKIVYKILGYDKFLKGLSFVF